MMDVHWKYANAHRHFGHSGLNMLAFKADADQTGYMQGMNFSEITLANMKTKLAEDFVRTIRDFHAKGITFEEFSKLVSNDTMATRAMKSEVIQYLASQGDLVVTGPKGSQKRSEKINEGDIILPKYEKQLVFAGYQIQTIK